ncbi:hypothetical protein GH714_023113 [Hevea brasiliensis]|uniref:Potassium channel domain-containing protein n=1 Tax=Hevea brasiliensis TaxID=3981 RepID=A0A6A6KJ40_HEVBR|nr:hypothetical protein GH714_023113 [Hevea brasiliensis]
MMQVAAAMFVYLVLASCFYLVRDDIEGTKTNPIIDAVYFCVVTMTTVGYGDLVPNTAFLKLLASVYVFLGMAVVGLILSKAADYLVEKQEMLLIKALNNYHKIGYGDESFSTRGGRAFAIFWILISTLCLGQFFLNVAEMFTESRQRALVNWILTRKITNLDLEADVDNDGVVGAAEFVIYKLKRWVRSQMKISHLK